MHRVDFSQRHSRDRHVVDCGAARVSVYSRSLATVVCIDGEVDMSNAELMAARIRRFAKVRNPLILDLSRLDFLGVAGFRELLALNHEYQTARLYCSIVAGEALRPLLRVVGDHGLLLVDSVPEALQLIDDALTARRRLVAHLAR